MPALATATQARPALSRGEHRDDSLSTDTSGTVVTAVSRYTGKKGKQFAFEVVASDPGGETGKAVHKRATVDVQRSEEGA